MVGQKAPGALKRTTSGVLLARRYPIEFLLSGAGSIGCTFHAEACTCLHGNEKYTPKYFLAHTWSADPCSTFNPIMALASRRMEGAGVGPSPSFDGICGAFEGPQIELEVPRSCAVRRPSSTSESEILAEADLPLKCGALSTARTMIVWWHMCPVTASTDCKPCMPPALPSMAPCDSCAAGHDAICGYHTISGLWPETGKGHWIECSKEGVVPDPGRAACAVPTYRQVLGTLAVPAGGRSRGSFGARPLANLAGSFACAAPIRTAAEFAAGPFRPVGWASDQSPRFKRSASEATEFSLVGPSGLMWTGRGGKRGRSGPRPHDAPCGDWQNILDATWTLPPRFLHRD